MRQNRRISLDQYPDIMTTNDFIEYWGVSRETAFKIIHRPDFPKISTSRKYIIIKSALQEWQHKAAIGERFNEVL